MVVQPCACRVCRADGRDSTLLEYRADRAESGSASSPSQCPRALIGLPLEYPLAVPLSTIEYALASQLPATVHSAHRHRRCFRYGRRFALHLSALNRLRLSHAQRHGKPVAALAAVDSALRSTSMFRSFLGCRPRLKTMTGSCIVNALCARAMCALPHFSRWSALEITRSNQPSMRTARTNACGSAAALATKQTTGRFVSCADRWVLRTRCTGTHTTSG